MGSPTPRLSSLFSAFKLINGFLGSIGHLFYWITIYFLIREKSLEYVIAVLMSDDDRTGEGYD